MPVKPPSVAEELTGKSAGLPWQATARAIAQRVGLDPRYLRRLRWLHKAKAVRHSGKDIRQYWQLIVASPEPDNYTYEIANEPDLAGWTARVSGCDAVTAQTLIDEPRHDSILMGRLRSATAGHWLWSKRCPPFGKRLGWYGVVRVLRPRLVLETGAHDGLGSLLVLRALERNGEDGFPGRLVSFDVNRAAGWLVGDHRLWELRIQSSHEGMSEVLATSGPLDLFIYDGWHTYEAESADLTMAASHLSPHGVLLSDDAQVSRALHDVCRQFDLEYFEFQELPVRHFYPGAVLAAGRRRLEP